MSDAAVAQVRIGEVVFGDVGRPVLIAGPCVIESRDHTLRLAEFLQDLAARLGIAFVFKASYDKANRSSVDSYRGPGLEPGLAILREVRERLGLPVLSDVHSVEEAAAAGSVLDIIQVPAFLCRQTDIVVAAARTGRPVNLKKGQFMAPADMRQVVGKARAAGNQQLLLTERGTTFGYHNLVVDFRSLVLMRQLGCPVVFDATHSVQLPGGLGDASDGQRCFAPPLARAAAAVGIDGLFIEVHDDPDRARCDGPNCLPLSRVEQVVASVLAIAACHATGDGDGA